MEKPQYQYKNTKQASDYTFPRTIVNLIIDHIKIGFASGDVNPLDKVILVNNIELVKINKSNSICVPTNHREVIVRWYNTVPSYHDEAVQDSKTVQTIKNRGFIKIETSFYM